MNRILRNIILFLIFLASSWSLLKPGFFSFHDFTHGARIAEMTRALEDGHFPVRWSKNFGFGYGMPLFEFYAPLPFYVGSFFYWLGLDLVTSIKILFLICNVGTLLGGFYLGQALTHHKNDPKIKDLNGLIFATLLTLAPYRAVNLFVRGALSEAWGIMAFPWILLGIVQIIQQKKQAWKTLLLGLIILFLSHNLMTMIFVPFSLVFGLAYFYYEINKKESLYQLKGKLVWLEIKKTVFKTAGVYLLAIAACTFYLFPAFLEKNLTQVDKLILESSGYWNFQLHFLYLRQLFKVNWGYGGSFWGPNDDMSFFLGYPQIISLLISGFFIITEFITRFKNKKKFNKINFLFNIFLFLLLLSSVLLTTSKTSFLWEKIELLSYIQFPWRFLSLIILVIALISVFVINQIQHKILLKIIYFLLLFSTLILNYHFFKPDFYLDNPKGVFYEDEQKIRKEMSGILPDYLPTDMKWEIVPVDHLVLNDQLSKNDYKILIDKTQEKLIDFNLTQETKIDLAIAYYPGWQAEIDGLKTIVGKSNTGGIQISLPAGNHKLGIYFGYTTIRLVSDLVSLGAFFLIIYLLFIRKED